MLPSTGLFKATNCPFYDSGLCERPYCHFRHVKKDPSCPLDADEEVLEQLVSDAVQKVLQHSETPSSSSSEQIPHEDFVSKVVEDLLPIRGDIDSNKFKPASLPPAVPSYKPTPIAELNKKRHIPVPYTPRNCSIVQPKRQKSSEHLFVPPPKRGKPSEECPIIPSSEYNPDVDTNKCVGYSPSLPKNQANGTNNHSYIPSAIANLISPLVDYVPTGNNDRHLSYEPSGKKIQEPEYRPQFDSAISSSCKNYTPTNKAVLEELNLDEFTTELELLDEIIYEHSESVNKKHLEKLSDESSIEYLEGSDKSTDRKEEYVKDSLSKQHSTVNHNQSNTSAPCFGDVNVPNKPVDENDTPSKEDRETNDAKESLNKERHRHTKSSRHSTSSKHKSGRSSKSSTSKDNKHEDKHKHKKSKSSLKTEIFKEHKSSSSSKSSNKSRSSSTSKNHKSGSRSKEKHSSSKSKKESKHAKPKVSSEDNAGSSPLQQYGDDDDHDDIYANSCSNEPMTDPDDDEIAQECFKIFQEYAPACSSNKELLLQKASEKKEEEPEKPCKKQRVAHDKKAQALSKLVAPPRRKPYVNPAVTMIKRFEELKETYELKVSEKVARTTLLMRRVELGGLLTNNQSTIPTKDLDRGFLTANSSSVKTSSLSTTSTTSSATKLRIAHVPNVPNLLEEKTRVQSAKHDIHQRTMLKNRIGNSAIQQTAAQSAPKGGQRSAHVPTASLLMKPVILPEAGSKIPTSVRQKYLDFLIKEHDSFMSKEESYRKSAEAEKLAFNRSMNKNIYTSSVTGAIMRLRKEQGKSGANNTSGVVHHSTVLAGKKGKDWSVLKTKKPEVGSIYHRLARYLLTNEQLASNGFPRPHPSIRGKAVSKSPYDRNLPWEGNDRICCRCSKNYTVNSKGFQVDSGDCPHHVGKLSKSTYRCCSGGIDSPACFVAPFHVTHNFLMNNTGFVETLAMDDEPEDGDYGVYALDCEMVYTTRGLELARVTVVDRELKTVYDTMVKPGNPILDYATRFSGITEENMRDVTTTLGHVQAAMMSFINSKTILIGHSLDSDLRVLKLIHDTVVDTSVVYPHQRNNEFKNPLRSLVLRYLHRLIQESEGGHNSAEDAIASMELMLYRIKEDMKTS